MATTTLHQTIKPIEVGILGGTGMVGQHFIRFLDGHPWFRLTWLGASDRSAGKKLRDAVPWRLDGEMPASAARITVSESRPAGAPRLVFSAMDASVATAIERSFAEAGHIVVSNSRNHRMEPDVPLIVPEINPGHLSLIHSQRETRGWSGMIVTNPNCSTVVLAMALAPLMQFGIVRVIAATLQAVSGAGYPGVASMDILANVVPFISGEEEKMQQETQKILGAVLNGEASPLPARVSAHCHRVAVADGHTVSASVELSSKPSHEEVRRALAAYQGVPQQRNLPSAPPQPVVCMSEPDRPQPRRDASRGNGMSVFVGRLRECPVLDWKFVACGHNTIRGAAGAAVLNAELMLSEGFLD
ncbi:MAG: aspartate-semialdehyde dehydrogenase [Acidobacteriaceae bacterium]|nr:aspartate-semialdehyde dehydrogenase [Acidobacteriaceae bacterium]